jgi:hypothetical protein
VQIKVGKDVEAACRKCGEVWHVIVSMDGAKITKVQCKECMGYHRYKPPLGEAAVDKPPATAKPARKVVPGKTPRAGAKKPAAAPTIEADPNKPVRRYSARESYAPGERIAHPNFGTGVVEAVPDPGKVAVRFPDGRKTLIQGRV